MYYVGVVYICGCRGHCQVSFSLLFTFWFWDKGSHWIYSSWIQLDWLANKTQGSTWLLHLLQHTCFSQGYYCYDLKKKHNQTNLGRKGLLLLTVLCNRLSSKAVTAGNSSRAGMWRPWNDASYWLTPITFSAWFLTRITSPGMVSPWVLSLLNSYAST